MKESNVIMRVLALFGSLRVTVVGLLLLLILTVWGTLYQVDYGLYLAQERFYQSTYFLIAGFIPFPGAQLVMAVLFVNLLTSMLLLTLRHRMHAGLLITHFGLMLMLAAGAVTFYLGKSAQLSLEEGAASNVATSFGEWELAVFPAANGPHHIVSALDAGELKPGRTITLPDGHTSIQIEEYFRNCTAGRESVDHPPENSGGITTLTPSFLSKEPGEDIPGVVFSVLENGQEQNRFLLWGGDAGPTSMGSMSDTWIGLRRMRLPLPAVIQLLDFRRELHPGSEIAKSYSSQVLVKGGDGLERKVLISMNKPLRLRGFTFYQSSFASDPGGREISTFSVVQNYGRLMPYIATGVTVAGMLLHFLGMLISRQRRRTLVEAGA